MRNLLNSLGMRHFILLVFCFGFTIAQAQKNFKFGKFSQEEINLTQVDYDPEAVAVYLHDEGHLKITNYGYEITYYVRLKILNPKGFRFATYKHRYIHDSFNDLKLVRAHTVNFEDGKPVISQIKKRDLIVEQVDGTLKVLNVAFPNIKVGSIIEYELKVKRTTGVFSTPWTFHNKIPTLNSYFKIINTSVYDFRVIQLGQDILDKYKYAKRRRDWELENLPSYESYSHIYNPVDIVSRIMIQHNTSGFQHGTIISAKNWGEFKTALNREIDQVKKGVNFAQMAGKIPYGDSDLETIANCVKYVQDNFEWSGKYSIRPYTLTQLTRENKKGHTAELNIILYEILKNKNIYTELVINSNRKIGKLLLEFPSLSRMASLENYIKLENGETILINAAISDPEDIKFLDINSYNQYVLSLEKPTDIFLKVQPPLSESIILSQAEVRENGDINFRSRLQFSGYLKDANIKLEGLQKLENKTTQKGEVQNEKKWDIVTHSTLWEGKNTNMIEFQCPFYDILDFIEIQNDRNYAIELAYPLHITAQAVLVGHYKDVLESNQFKQLIQAFGGNLAYQQQVEQKGNSHVISWSLLINQTNFTTQEFDELKDFIEQFKLHSRKSVFMEN